MAAPRPRSTADIRRELEAAERRFEALYANWQEGATIRELPAEGAPARAVLERVEAVLRNQRGAVDRLHQLWIEYAQTSGMHAPQ
jgi:hypothetical protein